MVQERESFVKLHEAPFGRAGSYWAFFMGDVAEQSFGLGELYLGTSRGTASTMERNKLMRINPLWKGIEIPYAVTTTPYELIIDTDHGTARICIAEPGLIRIHTDGEISLQFYSDMFHCGDLHENTRDMYDGTWTVFYAAISNWLLVPVKGTLTMDAPWDWKMTMSKYVRAVFSPEGSDGMEIAIEEQVDYEDFRRPEYPSYEESVQMVKDDFDSFCAKIPEFKNPLYESVRAKAAWIVWSHIVNPSRIVKSRMIMMMHIYMAHCSGWQQATHAACLSDNMELSRELIKNMYYHQGEDGQLADVVLDSWAHMKAGKPPFQGFALLWLMEHRDFRATFTDADIEFLYEHISKQIAWIRAHRVMPGHILPFFGNPDESGWDDATVYLENCQMITPDIVTYFILLLEAESRLAGLLGRADDEKYWKNSADEVLHEMITKMWNGKQFNALVPNTEEVFETESLCCYQPILLGKRLPQDIIDKMAEDLSVEGDFLTPYGVASEKLSSPYVNVYTGWVAGPVIAPMQLQIAVGLAEAGKTELSKTVANRYCTTLAKGGFYHINNPFTGHGMDKGRDGVLHQHQTSWSATIFLMLAGHYCD